MKTAAHTLSTDAARAALRPTPLRFAPMPKTDTRDLHLRIRELEEQVTAQQERIAELADQSTTDDLTGLANRRGFTHALAALVNDHLRYGYQGALISLDLNNFKHVNDQLGHGCGDALLVHVAKLLRRHTRETDTVARLGGDEFAIILKEADAAQANQRARQLAALFDSQPCHLETPSGLRHVQLSASLGVATIAEAPSAEAVTALADRRMYGAKRQTGQAR